jgi:hypothetical protein
MSTRNWRLVWITLVIGGIALGSSGAFAGGKIALYGVRMEPEGDDAERFSRVGWGGGVQAVLPIPRLSNALAGTFGFEIVNLLTQTTEFRDRATGLRVEQQTSQDYFRIYAGARIGGHGHGFFRPHAGINFALVPYRISTDVVVPDDFDRENEIRQNLRDRTEAVLGYDITLGVDLNFYDKFNVDGGVRYLKSLSVPQQLGAGSVKVHPDYFQIYLALGISFDYLKSLSESDDEEDEEW